MSDLFRKIVTFVISENGNKKGIKLLDVGCGNGNNVRFFRNQGIDAFGIDVSFKPGKYVDELVSAGLIRNINIGEAKRSDISEGSSYLWPDFGLKFDLIVSRAVIEQVRNLEEFVRESGNALNEDAMVVHYFPSKYALIEPHTGVLFGGCINIRLWFLLWCKIGLCFKTYKNKGNEAFVYMRELTSFRSKKEIVNIFAKNGFLLKADRTDLLLKLHRSKALRSLGRLKVIPCLFGILRSRVLVFCKA